MRYFVIALLLAGGAAAYWLTRPEPVAVALATVERGTVRATVSNTRVGTVEACNRARMSPSMPGQVARLPVREGDTVPAGAVLLEIWTEDLEAEQRHAEAQATAAERRVEEACAQAAGARRDAERLRRLSTQRLVSEEALDNAETQAESRAASCAASRAAVDVAQAQREVIVQQIEKSRLRAPFAGVVAELNAKLGEFITPSPTGIPTLPAIDLIDMTCMYVSAPIDEVDAPAIRPGMSACVALDAFDTRRCGATVRRIAPYVLDREKQARTVEVEVELTQPEDLARLLPGYSADIEILIEERTDTLRIPSEAVIEGRRVLVLDPASGRLEAREFEPGLANWEFTEVASGLEAGEQVVLSVGRKGVTAGVLAVAEDDDAG